MKATKKILAALLVVMMIAALLPNAFAATITVENNDAAHGDENDTVPEDYYAYKLFDAERAADNDDAIVYKISTSNPFFGILFNEDGSAKSGNVWFTASKVSEGVYVIIPDASFTGETQAKACAAWLNANKGSAPGIELEIGDNTVDDGYYLVTSSLGSNLGLATTGFGMTIVEKNEYPSIDKKQNDQGADATYSDADVSVQVGDTIWYEIVVDVPATVDKVLTVTDTMSAGLTFTYTAGSSFTVSVGDSTSGPFSTAATEGTDWSVKSTSTNGWVIELNATDVIKNHAVEIKFAAKVNDQAVVVDTTKVNEVELVYSNFKQTAHVNYKDYATGAVKYDGSTVLKDSSGNPVLDNGALQPKDDSSSIKFLNGAEFKLMVGTSKVNVVKDGTYYRPAKDGETDVAIVSDSNGEIIIRGLDADKTYSLVETKAPTGYNPVPDAFNLTLTEDKLAGVTISGDASATVTKLTAVSVTKIENNQGNALPTTGGIGTTMFYVIGSVMVICAGVLLVSKKRMGAAE